MLSCQFQCDLKGQSKGRANRDTDFDKGQDVHDISVKSPSSEPPAFSAGFAFDFVTPAASKTVKSDRITDDVENLTKTMGFTVFTSGQWIVN